MKAKRLFATLPLVAAIGLAACGGGGGSSSSTDNTNNNTQVDALKMPTTLSVLAADTPTSVVGAPSVRALVTDFLGASRAINTNFPSTSDFAKDPTNTYVYDSSMESLQTVNMILCLMDQTEADTMLNKGTYIALVDEDKCEQGKNQSSAGSTGQSAGAKTVTYNKWTINSTRASNSTPQIVKIWIPGEYDPQDPGAGQNIMVEVTISQGVSTTKPFGSFVLNFAGEADSGLLAGGVASGTSTTTMRGTLQTVDDGSGKPHFEFIEYGGTEIGASTMPYGYRQATNVLMDDATGTTGKARTYLKLVYDPDGTGPTAAVTDERAYAIHFNADLARKAKDSDGNNLPDAEACMDRKNYNTQVWRYNLYDNATGQRVSMNSGFPFTYDTGTNGTVYGHVGYWGIWAENNTVVPDGATIVERNYQNNTTVNHTVRIAPGKLVKRTANTETVPSLQGVELYYWGQDPSGQTTNHGQYLATVDSNNDFVATDSVAWDQNGRTVTPLSGGPYVITPSSNGQGLWLWSDALGGNVTYIHDTSITNPASRTVTFYAQEFVRPDDAMFAGGTVNLNCYDRCLKGGITTQAAIDAMAGDESQLYHASDRDPTGGYTPLVYTVSVSSGKVIVSDHLGATVSFDGLDLTSLGHEWGVSTSEMVTGIVTNFWDVYSASPSYRWETGSNQWNKMVMVQNTSTNALAVFDKPLQFNYTHTTADDLNGNSAFNNKKMMLQYGGDGELWGFPWQQDPNDPTRWFNPVTLKNGVQLTDGAKTYVVKAIEQQQTMKLSNPGVPGDVSACDSAGLNAAGLFADATFTLPTSVSGNVSIVWSGKPAPVTTNPIPAVIGGVVQ